MKLKDMSNHELVLSFGDYTKKSARRTAATNWILSAALAGSIGLNVAQFMQPEATTVPIAIDELGRVIPLVALNQSTMSDLQLRSWAEEAIKTCLTTTPEQYRRNLENCREHFTTDGYDSFLVALQESHFEERILDGLANAEPTLTGPVVIREKLEFNGRLGLILELPVLVTFRVGRQYTSADWIVSAMVLRVPQEEKTRGVAIQQLEAIAR